MGEFTENDLRAIERDRDLPPDDLRGPAHYGEAVNFLNDAIDALDERNPDPEDALRCAREAVARIEATI